MNSKILSRVLVVLMAFSLFSIALSSCAREGCPNKITNIEQPEAQENM